jgi:hypothetical protein
MQPNFIVGAGLAGLIAGHVWPSVNIYEAGGPSVINHRALLRFRTDSVSKLTGIPFKQVTVRKGIYYQEAFHQTNIQLANWYANKVVGRLAGDRSIWQLAPVERFIAPEDFLEQMIHACRHRTIFNTAIDFSEPNGPIISTAPMFIPLRALGMTVPESEGKFERSGITVTRYRIPGANVYQTIYFPDPHLKLYRASITGDLLIVESSGISVTSEELMDIKLAFGLREFPEYIDEVDQKFGKIVNIPDTMRKRLLFKLTADHGIYSLGRFACWRNILLDDVVEDCAVIKRLLMSSDYDLFKK